MQQTTLVDSIDMHFFKAGEPGKHFNINSPAHKILVHVYLCKDMQQRLQLACASVQFSKSLGCLYIKCVEVDEGSDQNKACSPTRYLCMLV